MRRKESWRTRSPESNSFVHCWPERQYRSPDSARASAQCGRGEIDRRPTSPDSICSPNFCLSPICVPSSLPGNLIRYAREGSATLNKGGEESRQLSLYLVMKLELPNRARGPAICLLLCSLALWGAGLLPGQDAPGPVPSLASGQPVNWWFVFKFNTKTYPDCGGTERVCLFGGTVEPYKSRLHHLWRYEPAGFSLSADVRS